MANISSINGNPIVVGTSGISDGAVTPNKLASGIVQKADLFAGDIVVDEFPIYGYVGPDGSFVDGGTTYKRTGYIRVESGDCFIAHGIRALGLYDSDKVFYYRYISITDNKPLIVYKDGYMVVDINASTEGTAHVTKTKSVPGKSYLFGDREFVGGEVPLSNVQGAVSHNLVKPERCIDNAYVVATTGSYLYNVGYFCTEPFEVEAGEIYKCNRGRSYAFYDSDLTYISGAVTIPTSGLIAPDNAAYLALSVNKSSDGTSDPYDLYVAKASEYDPTEPHLTYTPSAWCKGMSINWIGDSIVAGADFDEVVTSVMGLFETDYGINGSTIALKDDGTDPRHAICLRYADMGDADIIAVSAGTNDFQYAIPDFGTIESTDNTTFYGALKTLCEGLIDKYPQKVIFFTTPIKRGQPFDGTTEVTTPFSQNAKGHTLKDYRDAIIEVCGYYSIPVLDLWGESLLNPHLDSQADMFDSVRTHPGATAMRIMARRVCGWLSQLGYNV